MVSLRLAALFAACAVSVLAAYGQSTVTVYVGYNNTQAFQDNVSGSTSSYDGTTATSKPAITRIHEGDAVQFTWQGSPHNINPYPDGTLHISGYTTSQTASQIMASSTWNSSTRLSTYACSAHPRPMTGQIFIFESARNFRLTAPNGVTSGAPFGITVAARGQNNSVDELYGGTIHFSSSDSDATVQLPPDYTFVPADNGTHTFQGVVLKTVNPAATITVSSSAGGLTGNANIRVDTAAPQPPGNLRVSPSGKGF
jgi:plastocyanin